MHYLFLLLKSIRTFTFLSLLLSFLWNPTIYQTYKAHLRVVIFLMSVFGTEVTRNNSSFLRYLSIFEV